MRHAEHCQGGTPVRSPGRNVRLDGRATAERGSPHVAPHIRAFVFGLGAMAIGATMLLSSAARADTVASLLGNFTINQYSGVALTADAVTVHRAVVFGQLPALRELHAADIDGDGVTTDTEREAYGVQRAQAWADELDLTIDGRRVPLHVARSTTSLPTEQGGFSLRVDADFEAPLSLDRATTHTVTYTNRNFNGRFGWNEIAVTTAAPWKAFDANTFDTSLTGGLTEALQTLPASGPLQERSINLQLVAGAIPSGAVALGPREGMANAAAPSSSGQSANRVANASSTQSTDPSVSASNGRSASPTSNASSEPPASNTEWLQRQTRRLVDLVAQRDPSLSITLLALLAATLLGAVHAFSPGHGKTVVGAYLIGSRATARHAMFLGATVTITHTLGVFALGFATLLAANWIVPERIIPLLSILSGVLVLGMGAVLLVQRWPRRSVGGFGGASAGHGGAWIGQESASGGHGVAAGARMLALSSAKLRAWAPATSSRVASGALIARMGGYAPMALGHAHAHAGHSHGSEHAHGAGSHSHAGNHSHADVGHSHGGTWHTHMPPGANNDDVSWRSLLALGISGGLVPCPSALVILLAAVALNRTAYGLLLVLAFSAGLAITLTLVGLAFLYARRRLPSNVVSARWIRWLPMASAAAIVGVGVLLCYAAFTTIPQ